MKSSKEIADTVFRVRDEYLEKKRIRNIKIKKITSCCSAACLCAIVLVCAKNMQLPSVEDWINPSSDTSDSDSTQDSTTIKIVTSEDTSELPATDNINNQTPPVSTPSTDIREENKNTEHSDNSNTITTAKSDGDGNNIKTSKHSDSQNAVTTRKAATGSVSTAKTTKRSANPNTVTTRKPAAGSVNTTKATKHTNKPNTVTTRKPSTGSVNTAKTTKPATGIVNTTKTTKRSTNQETVTTRKPATDIAVTNPKTTKRSIPATTATDYDDNTTNSLSPSATKPEATTIRFESDPVTAPTQNIIFTVTVQPRPTETTLVKLFTEINYNSTIYQANLISGMYEETDYNSIDDYIDMLLFDASSIGYNDLIACEIYKIKNVPVNDAIAVKFWGYNTYFIYRRRL